MRHRSSCRRRTESTVDYDYDKMHTRQQIGSLYTTAARKSVKALVSDVMVTCGSVGQWLGRWTCDWRSRVQSQPLHCRVRPWTSPLSSASEVTTLWRYINQFKF